MMALTANEFSDWRRRAEGEITRLRRAAPIASHVAEVAVDTGITAGTAFGLGVAMGRTGRNAVANVPVPLGAAVLLHGLGVFADPQGRGKTGAKILHSAGNGAAAMYLGALGTGVGTRWRERSGGGGELPAGATSGETIPDADLASMARGGL